MPRRPTHAALFLLPFLAAACSPHAKQKLDRTGPQGAHTPSAPPAVGADAGLEVTTFISGVSQHALAASLAPYSDQPLPISHELEDLWSAHGLRMV